MENKEIYTTCKRCTICGHISYSNDILYCMECLEADGTHIELEESK